MNRRLLDALTTRRGAAAAGMASLLALAGCASSPADTAPLSGAASMRVDVEVYKGPLSKEKPVQQAELFSKIRDGRNAFSFVAHDIATSMCRIGCFQESVNLSEQERRAARLGSGSRLDPASTRPGQITDIRRQLGFDYIATYQTPVPPECAPGKFPWRIEPREIDDAKYKVCPLLDQLYGESDEFARRLGGFPDFTASGANLRAGLLDASKLAEALHSRASFWANTHTSMAPLESRVRIAIANFAHFAADYGNQIGSRADTLVKLEDGVDGLQVFRDQLANSTYLRDSAPTAYLNLFSHNDAGVARSNETTLDRVRMVEQLVADTHWSRVNTVFAAGQGKTTMALVKDDIGNWNLKNFENLPGDLVNAYKNAGLAIVKAVGDVARDAASGGATAGVSRALALADQVALGAKPPTEVTDAVLGFNGRLRDQIATIGRAQRGRLTDLDKKIAESKARIDKQQPLVEAASTALTKTQGELDAIVAERTQREQDLIQRTSEHELLKKLIDAPPGGGTPTPELRQKSSDAEQDRRRAQDALNVSRANERAKILERDNLRSQQQLRKAEADKLVDDDRALVAERAAVARETVLLMRTAIRQHSGVIDQLQATPSLQQ